MQCDKCDGKGFIEFEHGLIMVGCDRCEGTGEIDDTDNGTKPVDSGTRQLDTASRGSDTSKPKRTRKPKASKKAGKRAG